MQTYLIIVGVILIIACLIHWFSADCLDLGDFFIDEHGWITITAVLGGGLVIAGFIFWIWWATLIIVIAVAGITIAAYYIYEYVEYGGYGSEDEAEEEDDEKTTEKSKYKCVNCGANLIRVIKNGSLNAKNSYYRCEYCGINYTKRDLMQTVKNEDSSNARFSGIELNDFEEEYFEACEKLGFRPYNEHSEKEIERRYNKLSEKLYEEDGNFSDDDLSEQEEALDYANDFFAENDREITKYIANTPQDDIKLRYEYYIYLNNEETD